MKKSMIAIMTSLSLMTVSTTSLTPILTNLTVHANQVQYQKPSQSVKLQRVVNVRDLGGYKNSKGQTIKQDKLIRSAQLSNLTKSDQDKLVKNHHVGTIVDLRTPDEIKKAPDTKMNGVKDIQDPVHSDKNQQQKTSAKENKDQKQLTSYKNFVVTQQGRDAYKQLFKQLLNNPNDKAVLWHCSAGKDRTGFGTALVLTALGFNKQDIYHDYLKSNYYDKNINMQKADKAKHHGASKQQIQDVYNKGTVKTQYLNIAYKEATQNYGSMNGYLHKGLGLYNQDIQKLQNMYLNNK